MDDRLTQRTAGQRREKLLWDDRMAGSARGGVAVFSPSTQQHGNIGTCLMLNKKGSRQCRRIGVQSKETSMAPWSAAWLWGWWRQKRVEAQPRRKRQAASHVLVWRIHQRSGDCKQTTQPKCRNHPTSSLAARRSFLLVPTTRSMRCRKTEAWQTGGTWMTATSCVTRPFFLQEFDVADATVGAERNPQ